MFLQNVCLCVSLCPHLVSEQVVLVIDVCVRLGLRKQILHKFNFLSVFTDVTLKVKAHVRH